MEYIFENIYCILNHLGHESFHLGDREENIPPLFCDFVSLSIFYFYPLTLYLKLLIYIKTSSSNILNDCGLSEMPCKVFTVTMVCIF